jgi:large subunit ribosomal protein L24
MKLKIKKDDIVSVIAGSNKGKTGKVLSVDIKNLRVVVEGINVVKKHVKPSQKNPQGGILSKESSVHYSNVLLLDSKGKPSRVGIKRDKGGKSVRFAKSTGEALTAK